MPIRFNLELSTKHLPDSDPDFGSLPAFETDYGFIVIPLSTEYIGSFPEWIQPIVRFAEDNGCSLIHFDRDAQEDNQFKTYDW